MKWFEFLFYWCRKIFSGEVLFAYWTHQPLAAKVHVVQEQSEEKKAA